MSLAFELPPELEAGAPPPERDEVRMLVAAAGRPLVHARFRDLPGFLRRGDLLVVNASATLPAALPAGGLTLHLSTPLPGAFPGEDISDRPPPEDSVPGLLALIEGSLPSGRYRTAELAGVGR